MLQTLQPIFDFDADFVPSTKPKRHKKKRSAFEKAFRAADLIRRYPGLTRVQAAKAAESNVVYLTDLGRILAVPGALERVVAIAGITHVWDVVAKSL